MLEIITSETITFFGDTHSNSPALEASLNFIFKRDPNSGIFSPGDDAGYGPDPAGAMKILKRYGIKSVQGNHDGPVAKNEDMPGVAEEHAELVNRIIHWNHDRLEEAGEGYLEHLGSYPLDIRLEFGGRSLPFSTKPRFGGRNIILSHGNPKYGDEFRYVEDIGDEEEVIRWMEEQEPQYDICVVGHTHKQRLSAYKKNKKELISKKKWKTTDGDTFSTRRLRLDRNKKYIINPGSVGQARDNKSRACFAYLEKDWGGLYVVFVQLDYDIPELIGKFNEANLAESLKKLGQANGEELKKPEPATALFPQRYIDKYYFTGQG